MRVSALWIRLDHRVERFFRGVEVFRNLCLSIPIPRCASTCPCAAASVYMAMTPFSSRLSAAGVISSHESPEPLDLRATFGPRERSGGQRFVEQRDGMCACEWLGSGGGGGWRVAVAVAGGGWRVAGDPGRVRAQLTIQRPAPAAGQPGTAGTREISSSAARPGMPAVRVATRALPAPPPARRRLRMSRSGRPPAVRAMRLCAFEGRPPRLGRHNCDAGLLVGCPVLLEASLPAVPGALTLRAAHHRERSDSQKEQRWVSPPLFFLPFERAWLGSLIAETVVYVVGVGPPKT